MKEKIIFFILGLVLLFVPGINSHAENENPIYPEDNPVDDSIFEDDDLLYDNGYAFFFIRERDNFNGATTRTYYKANIEVSEGFKPFYVRSADYSLESRYQLIVRKNSVSTKKDLVNDKGGKISFNGSWKWFNPDSKEVYNGGELTDVYEKEQPYAMFFSGQDSRWLGYHTNIPIFDLESATFFSDLNKYLTNGDYSGAINSDFIDRSNSSVDKSVDFPHEFQTSQCVINWTGTIFEFKGRDSINASWKVPDDTSYNYQIQMKAMIKFPKNDGKIHIGKNGFEDKWTDWHDVEIGDYSVSSNGRKVCYINPSLMLKLFNDDIHSVKYGSPDLMGVAYDIKGVQFRVRHLKGNKCSNWVSSYIESSGSSNTYLEDDDGNYIDNTEYQGQQTSTDYNSGDFKANDIISFIKSGFGLSGSNGLIAMFKQFFSYLPPSVNVILLTGVAIMVFVAVVKWITTVV